MQPGVAGKTLCISTEMADDGRIVSFRALFLSIKVDDAAFEKDQNSRRPSTSSSSCRASPLRPPLHQSLKLDFSLSLSNFIVVE